MIIDSANGEDVSEIPEVVSRCFLEKIDLTHLKLILPDAISTVFAGSVMKKVTNMGTISDTFNQNIIKGIFGEVDKLL